MDQKIINITFHQGMGHMTVVLDAFFPTDATRLRKLLSIIDEDYEHQQNEQYSHKCNESRVSDRIVGIEPIEVFAQIKVGAACRGNDTIYHFAHLLDRKVCTALIRKPRVNSGFIILSKRPMDPTLSAAIFSFA